MHEELFSCFTNSPFHQRVALCTMENICHQMLPSQGPSLFMDAVPILSKLLKYKDEKVPWNRTFFFRLCVLHLPNFLKFATKI